MSTTGDGDERPLVLVTRPEGQAARTAEALERIGCRALVAPLMTIEPVPDPTLGLDGVQAVLLTSANGADALARATDRRDIAILAVGDATAETARLHGFSAVESAAGDVSTLAALARTRLDPNGGPLVHVAGTSVAGDLVGDLGASGFDVRRVAAYTAEPVEALPPEAVAALREGRVAGATFFSPRTARVFARLLDTAGSDGAGSKEALAGVHAFALSRAVAGEISALPWAGVHVAHEPTLDALVEAVAAVLVSPAGEAGAAPPPDRSEMALRQEGETTPEPESRRPVGGSLAVPLAFTSAVLVVALIAILLFAPGLMRDRLDLARAPVMEEQREEIAALRAEVEELRTDTVAGGAAPMAEVEEVRRQLTDLVAEVETLRARPDEDALTRGDLAITMQRLDALASEIAELEAEEDQAARIEAHLTATLGDVSDRIDDVRARILALEDRVAAMERRAADAEPQRIATAMIALADLRETIGSGRPFDVALDRVRETLPGEVTIPVDAQWTARSADGLPTDTELARRLDDLADRGGDPVRVRVGLPWLDRAINWAVSGIEVRDAPDESEVTPDDPRADPLERAARRTRAGDLEAAVQVVETAGVEEGSALAEWLAMARLRVDALGDVAALERQVVQVASGSRS